MVELRKEKKETDNDRRRNISVFDSWSDNEDFAEDVNENIDLGVKQILDLFKTINIFELNPKYVRLLRKMIPKQSEAKNQENQSIVEELMSADIIRQLLKCLANQNCSMSLLNEVVALMAHLCASDKKHTLVLVKYGIVNKLLALLSYDNLGVIEQSVLCLTYIWNSSPEMSQMLKTTPFLDRLVGLINSETSVSPSKYVQNDSRIGLVRALSWALLIFCQNHDPTAYSLSIQFIPYFVKLLKYDDTEVKKNVLKTLSVTTDRVVGISEEESSPVRQTVESVVCEDSLLGSIIEYLSSKEDEVVLNGILIIGNIVSWGESLAQIVIQAKTLQRFEVLLTHQNPKIQREVAFTVANITAGNSAQIQAVIDANLIPAIVELLYMGDYRTQVEASHVFLNISAVGSLNQINYMLNLDNSITNMDVIDAMASLITSLDASVINTCLQFYNNILIFAKKIKILSPIVKRCDTSSLTYHLDGLQSHNNSQISLLATRLVEEYFTGDLSFEEDITYDTSLMDEKQMETNISF